MSKVFSTEIPCLPQGVMHDPQQLKSVLDELPAGVSWQLGQLQPQRLVVEGDEQTRRLSLSLSIYLAGENPDQHVKLAVQMYSDPWTYQEPFPPVTCHRPLPPLASSPGGLGFHVDTLTLHMSHDGAGWLRYLTLPMAMRSRRSAHVPLDEQIVGAIRQWLSDTRIDTPAGANSYVLYGPIGYFGPVEPRLLERTGQTDLMVDATLLGEDCDNSCSDQQPSLTLTLYGERHGLWLLNRRTALPIKVRPKEPPPAVIPMQSEVIVAHDAAELIATVGLGPVEKRLFQGAELLQPERLWSAEQVGEQVQEQAELSAMLDLGKLPPRSRRHLQSIATLALHGRLSNVDIDLLLRTAQHLSARGK